MTTPTESNQTTNFYLHPIFVPTLLLVPAFMIIPILGMTNKVTTQSGYILLAFMVCVTIILTAKVIKYLVMICKEEPALTLDEDYLNDYLRGTRIRLDYIEGFQISRINLVTTYVSVKLNDRGREKYFLNIKNPVNAFTRNIFSKLTGDFSINVRLFKDSNDKILEKLNNHLATRK